MAQKNDDIKNLFMNLGLNPSDYHEIRSAPMANVTMTDAPRRWSLLQSTRSPSKSSAKLSAVSPAPKPAPMASVDQPSSAVSRATAQPYSEPVVAQAMPESLSAALLAAAQDIVRAETTERPAGMDDPRVGRALQAASKMPAPANEVLQQSPSDGLQSLFQSVKEPKPANVIPVAADVAPQPGRRTDRLAQGEVPLVSQSISDRANRMPEPAVPAQIAAALSAAVAKDEPETRLAQPKSRLGPIPSAASVQPSAQAPAPVAKEGKLKLSIPKPSADASPAVHGESLQGVFQRLSRENRG